MRRWTKQYFIYSRRLKSRITTQDISLSQTYTDHIDEILSAHVSVWKTTIQGGILYILQSWWKRIR